MPYHWLTYHVEGLGAVAKGTRYGLPLVPCDGGGANAGSEAVASRGASAGGAGVENLNLQ